MKPEMLLHANLLDILFADRNKEYGAFILRKDYARRLQASVVIVIIFSLCLALLFSFSSALQNKKFISPPEIIEVTLSTLQTKKEVNKKVALQPKANKVVQQVANPTYIIVPDDKASKRLNDIHDLDKSEIGITNVKGQSDTGFIVQGTTGTDSGVISDTALTIVKQIEMPFDKAEIMPQFPGGNDALVKYFVRNLRPAEDLEAGEKIVVNTKFVINESGRVEAPEILGKAGHYDNEVLRVIAKMPLWKPGFQNGTPVSVYFHLPVTFERNE